MATVKFTEEQARQSLADYKAFDEAKAYRNAQDELWLSHRAEHGDIDTLDKETRRAFWAKFRKFEEDWKEERNRRYNAILPFKGMPCTIVYYSDFRAATVTKVLSASRVEVCFNETKCKDYYAGEYEIFPELKGEPQVFTKRRNGHWCAEGQPTKDGVLLAITYQRHYIDPHY